MKITQAFRRTLTASAVFLALAAVLYAGASASGGSVYVNDSGNVLSGGISSAYAVGGSGDVSQLGASSAYAMTSAGLVRLGSGGPGAAAEGSTEHLSVSGSVAVKYDKIKVGLYYYDRADTGRNEVLENASLENCVGSGYEFGYFDSERTFHSVGYTSETALTMAIDRNVDTRGGHVGCYHILLPETYTDFESASAAASVFQYGFVGYYNGVYRVLSGQYDSGEDAAAAMNAQGISGSAFSASSKCVVVTRTSDARILFEFDCGSDRNLAVSPISASQDAVTWFKGFKYYGDFEYIRRTGELLTVVNVVGIENYIKGILPYEMNSSWPIEALKAQAVCARTYAVSSIGDYSSYGFDVTNDANSQVYKGINYATPNSDRAVESTAGQYITYDGKLISAFYYSSNGGGSENCENVFSAAYPYLRGVTDPWEADAASINGKSSWEITLPKYSIYNALRSSYSGMNISNLASLSVKYSDTGNAVGLTFTDSGGRSASLQRSSCYKFSTRSLGLYSIHYEIRDNGDSITFIGGGWGHSIGMSQFGAYAMAKKHGFTYDQIINFYYTDVGLSRGYTA